MTDIRALRVRLAGDYRLWVHFADGIAGTVDLGSLVQIGCFRLVRDRRAFATVRVDVQTGDLHWPVGARISASILHGEVARGEHQRLPTPATDPAFRRFLQRACRHLDGAP